MLAVGCTLVQDCKVKQLWCSFETLQLSFPFMLPWINLLTEYFCPLVPSRPLAWIACKLWTNVAFLAPLPFACCHGFYQDVPRRVQSFKMFPCYSGSDRKKRGILTMCLITGVWAYLSCSNSTYVFTHGPWNRSAWVTRLRNCQRNNLLCHVCCLDSFLLSIFSSFSFSAISVSFTSLHHFPCVAPFVLFEWLDESWRTPLNPLSSLAH